MKNFHRTDDIANAAFQRQLLPFIQKIISLIFLILSINFTNFSRGLQQGRHRTLILFPEFPVPIHTDLNLWAENFRRKGMRKCRRTHFRSDTAQRYIRAQRTRSKCRRCFTVLHHSLIPTRLHFPTHNFKLK